MKKNKKILLVYNPRKPNVDKTIKTMYKNLCNFYNVKICSSEKINSKSCVADIILTLGGDGTILKVGQYAVEKSIAVLGVNLGGLGYLAEFQADDSVYSVIKNYFSNDIEPQKRLVLEIFWKNKKFYALNDVIVKPLSAKVCNVELFINNQKITQIIGDGVIVATATGSTAYSLACGGSIVEPEADVLLITPISPHTLSMRPIIISSDKEVKMFIPEYKSNKNIILSLDGQRNFYVKHFDEIKIKKSEKRFLFIPNKDKNFYEILKEKLFWGKR
ncbi:MAG: NAD(+)/NADH kinase [Endomicrobiia bacterium]